MVIIKIYQHSFILQDPEEFQVAFDVLLAYVKIPENWSQIETELHGRGVC